MALITYLMLGATTLQGLGPPQPVLVMHSVPSQWSSIVLLLVQSKPKSRINHLFPGGILTVRYFFISSFQLGV